MNPYETLVNADQVVSAARFRIWCQGWTVGLGFSELAGFSSAVDHQEYSYNGRLGNVLTRQFGRAKPPSLMLKRGLDGPGFLRMFNWHSLARANNPMAKVPTAFTIMDASGDAEIACLLENAWCSKLEIDPAQAGASSVVMMKVTIECDAILAA
jgi:phage tail-like protein